jgi:hypothetical protein
VHDLCLTGHNLTIAIQLANASILEAEVRQVNKAELDELRRTAQKAQDMFHAHQIACSVCRSQHQPFVL